jgi:hypothetical protein
VNRVAQEFTDRLDRVRPRLERLAATPPPDALTDPDVRTGERWEWGQAWAHVAEFPAYWIRELLLSLDASGDEPVPFGRVASNPERLGAIEADRHTAASELWSRVSQDLDELRSLIGSLTDAQWGWRGVHSALGVMDMPGVMEEFLVGHLESHAEQLEGLLGGSPA